MTKRYATNNGKPAIASGRVSYYRVEYGDSENFFDSHQFYNRQEALTFYFKMEGLKVLRFIECSVKKPHKPE